MNGDFSRDTSGPAHLAHFTRVLLQQGRTLLDADFNEQSAIHHDFLRTLVVDLIGRGWRPDTKQFTIDNADVAKDGFKITKGHFYVDGILCDNPADCTYAQQPSATNTEPLDDQSFIAYIECWERHLSAVQRPELREIALGGPDTASRAQIVWQVRVATQKWTKDQSDQLDTALLARIKAADAEESVTLTAFQKSLPSITKDFSDEIAVANPKSGEVSAKSQPWFDALGWVRPRLRAMAKRDMSDNEACSISPDSMFRGRENQLYRVEIHQGGTVGTMAGGTPTFKWSRENGSVLFAVRRTGGIALAALDKGVRLTIALETLGHDRRTGLCTGDWVELTNDDFEFAGLAPPLGQIKQIDKTRQSVVVEVVGDKIPDFSKGTVLRRWDQSEHLGTDGTAPVVETIGANGPWTALERGVQIQFQPGGVYRTGDYWLIPARVPSGDVQWPKQGNGPAFVAPNGIERHRTAVGLGNKAGAKWKYFEAGRTLVPGI